MKLNREYQLEPKTLTIFRELQYEARWNKLSMGEQLNALLKIDVAIKKLKNMGQEDKASVITSEFVFTNISARGYNRLRKLYEFCNEIEEKHLEFSMNDPETKKKMLEFASGKVIRI